MASNNFVKHFDEKYRAALPAGTSTPANLPYPHRTPCLPEQATQRPALLRRLANTRYPHHAPCLPEQAIQRPAAGLPSRTILVDPKETL